MFKDAAIDEDEHKKALQDAANASKGNLIPKGVVSLESLYDLQNHFWGPVNVKTHNSTLFHEKIYLGTERDLKYVNLGTCCTPQERKAFICLFKQYRDVFGWTYNELKTYDTWMIQHVIPIKEGAKPFK